MSTRRKRLTKAEVAELERAIYDVLAAERPSSVRHVYYALAHHSLVTKTEAGYRRIQQRCLKMRMEGRLPFSWISDGTRYSIRPSTYPDVVAGLRDFQESYRRALWRDSGVYLEVWVESDSMAGVIASVTDKYDIALMSSRGFSSVTFLNRAAQDMLDIGKPAKVLYIGDYDPSGLLIGKNIESRLREFAPELEIEFRRMLINPDQIEKFELPFKPVKSSSHSSGFQDSRTVEAEAMPANQTRRILEEAILEHVDRRALEVARIAEEDERRILNLVRIDYLHKRNAEARTPTDRS